MNSAPRFWHSLISVGIVLRHGLVHGDRGRDAVLVEHVEDAEHADAVAVLVVAEAADVREPAAAAPQATRLAAERHRDSSPASPSPSAPG